MTELLDTVPCDGCPTETPDPTDCWHGRTLCPECLEYSPCHDCAREAIDE